MNQGERRSTREGAPFFFSDFISVCEYRIINSWLQRRRPCYTALVEVEFELRENLRRSSGDEEKAIYYSRNDKDSLLRNGTVDVRYNEHVRDCCSN